MPSRRRLLSISAKIALRDSPAPFGAGSHPAIDLGGDHDLVPPRKILDGATEDLLAVAKRIALAVSKKLIPASSAFLMNGRLSSSPRLQA